MSVNFHVIVACSLCSTSLQTLTNGMDSTCRCVSLTVDIHLCINGGFMLVRLQAIFL